MSRPDRFRKVAESNRLRVSRTPILTIISIVIISYDMSDNLGFLIADVSRLLRKEFDARVRKIGVTRPQWRVLTALGRMEGSTQGVLADFLDVEPITLCRMVDRLEEAALVERRAHPADRRAWQIFLTDKGHAMVAELRPIALSLFDDALNGLSAEETAMIDEGLERIRANLSRKPLEAALG
jgi:DNA-binding MarR family transcriptional regulator